MGLDVWFREDVARVLAATHETMQVSLGAAPPADPELAAAYRRGFADALQSVAVAFGLAAPSHPVSGHGRTLPGTSDWRVIDAEAPGRPGNGHSDFAKLR